MQRRTSALVDRWTQLPDGVMYSRTNAALGRVIHRDGALLGASHRVGTVLDVLQLLFVGVDENAYPRDFGVFVRYYYELLKQIEERYPMPEPLGLGELDRFLARHDGRYTVAWQ
jgi:hypothetical protein